MATWHELYSTLMTQIHERFPELPEQPTEAEIAAAIDVIEEEGRDVWTSTPGRDLPHETPMQFAVGPREILQWAKTEGPLSRL